MQTRTPFGGSVADQTVATDAFAAFRSAPAASTTETTTAFSEHMTEATAARARTAEAVATHGGVTAGTRGDARSAASAGAPRLGVGMTDGDYAVMAEVAAAFETSLVNVRVAQIAEIRALAKAGQLAEKQAQRSDTRTQAHDMALRSIAAEFAGLARSTDRTLQRRIGEARELVEMYPATLAAWEAGTIVRGHVHVIIRHGRAVPVDLLPEYEAAAIGVCRADTPNRVDGAVEMIAARVHPRTFAERHEEAAAGRCVKVVAGADGMSDLIATLPTVIADGIYDRLTQQARIIITERPTGTGGGTASDDRAGTGAGSDGVTTGGAFTNPAGGVTVATDGASTGTASTGADAVDDHRPMDAVRADVFADLLLTAAPALDPTSTGDGDGTLGAIRAKVQVIITADTLTGVDDGPADLVGRSPIDPASARRLAGGAGELERLLTHPVTGTIVEVDSYRHTTAMRRLLRGRDQRCRFPGCRQPTTRCETDHTTDWAHGGPTTITNLAHLCQRHHSMKQFTPWRVRQLSGGVLEWTSPLGRTYREDAPTPRVTFAPAQQHPTPSGQPRAPEPWPPAEPALPGEHSSPGEYSLPSEGLLSSERAQYDTAPF